VFNTKLLSWTKYMCNCKRVVLVHEVVTLKCAGQNHVNTRRIHRCSSQSRVQQLWRRCIHTQQLNGRV